MKFACETHILQPMKLYEKHNPYKNISKHFCYFKHFSAQNCIN